MSTQTTDATLSDSLRSLIGQPPLPHPEAAATRPVEPTPLPTLHHARSQLHEVERILLSMWTATLPNLDGDRTAHLCAAHRAVHEALLLLTADEPVVADLVVDPGTRSAPAEPSPTAGGRTDRLRVAAAR